MNVLRIKYYVLGIGQNIIRDEKNSRDDICMQQLWE